MKPFFIPLLHMLNFCLLQVTANEKFPLFLIPHFPFLLVTQRAVEKICSKDFLNTLDCMCYATDCAEVAKRYLRKTPLFTALRGMYHGY